MDIFLVNKIWSFEKVYIYIYVTERIKKKKKPWDYEGSALVPT